MTLFTGPYNPVHDMLGEALGLQLPAELAAYVNGVPRQRATAADDDDLVTFRLGDLREFFAEVNGVRDALLKGEYESRKAVADAYSEHIDRLELLL